VVHTPVHGNNGGKRGRIKEEEEVRTKFYTEKDGTVYVKGTIGKSSTLLPFTVDGGAILSGIARDSPLLEGKERLRYATRKRVKLYDGQYSKNVAGEFIREVVTFEGGRPITFDLAIMDQAKGLVLGFDCIFEHGLNLDYNDMSLVQGKVRAPKRACDVPKTS
jgi:hypothetical protein